jgi:hypothetical protein
MKCSDALDIESSDGSFRSRQPLPRSQEDLASPQQVACFLATRHLAGKPAILLRYGDTGGRIMARPNFGTPEFAYLRNYLGSDVSPEQVEWMAQKIEESINCADVIGVRSDLIGPNLPDDVLSGPPEEVLHRLADLYPLRAYERTSLRPDDAKRLAETRKSMERLPIPEAALVTDAWIHVGLAEIGFFSSLFRNTVSIAVCTSSKSRPVLQTLAAVLRNRVRLFECPEYPARERQWAGDHGFIWGRWQGLVEHMRPAYPGEPLLVCAGIWTKVIAPEWARRGGIAIDSGSVMDYFSLEASRPAVLATRYLDAKTVPVELSIERQLERKETLQSFVDQECG